MKRHVPSTPKKPTRRFLLIAILLLIVICAATALFRDLKNSLFFRNKERVNIVFYQKSIAYYSLGTSDNIDYVVPFYPDLQIKVPGGYGTYRIGALGKVVTLEKKPEIMKKTFSQATSSFVDYYFYNSSGEVYYGDSVDLKVLPFYKMIFSSTSNASLFDRIYLFSLLSKKRPQYFHVIDDFVNAKGNQGVVLDGSYFTKHYQGYFFEKTYRDEKMNVQLLYTNDYNGAANISNILEGSGIRVGDISAMENSEKQCIVVENSSTHSQTAQEIVSFFGCQLQKGDTDIYDILFKLGGKERDWE